MGSTDMLATASDGTVNQADIEPYATPRRRKRRRVFAAPVAAAQTQQPIVLDIRHLLWQLRAFCNGMDRELFFDSTQDVEMLRAICASCPVKQDCLDYANQQQLLGFWGGTTEAERKRERRSARRQAPG